MKAAVLLTVFVIYIPFAQAQNSKSCNCLENLNQTIRQTEENYAGFPNKVTEKNRAEYQTLIKKLRSESVEISGAKACFFKIASYVNFFHDKHFQFSYTNPDDYDRLILPISDDSLKRAFSHSPPGSIEGVWVNPDTSLRLAILKVPGKEDTFRGIVVESRDSEYPKGLVYFTLSKTDSGFIVKPYDSFSTLTYRGKQRENLFQVWNFQLWGRELPYSMSAAEQEEFDTWKEGNNGLTFLKLDSLFTYIKIPTFYNNDSRIQQLISENDKAIRSSPYLIVDLRGNGGGDTGWSHLLPYLITNPIIQPESYLRVSPANVERKLKDILPIVENPVSPELKKYFTADYLRKLKEVSTALPKTTKTFYPIPSLTIPVDSVSRYPRKVALIVDDLCGSSTEYFMYLMRQSKKTISYGVPTTGMMDYEGSSDLSPLPYRMFRLLIPIAKSNWTDAHPIDKTGFRPDVVLNVPGDVWVEYIRKDLKLREAGK